MLRNVAIVGAGIGSAHALGFIELPKRFAIAAICDLDLERAMPLCKRFDARYAASLDTILADPAIDIVDICLPPHLHSYACMQSLNAGKIVICEKPLVTSLAEADALAAKIDATGGALFPVFQYRYGKGMVQLRALIDAGLAGPCYAGSLETHWNRPASYYDVPWRGSWTGERGGAILSHAIHIHDLLTAVLGPVASVFAETATAVNDIEVEDCAALAIRMQSGALVTSSITLGAANDLSRLRLMFEGFTVESDHTAYAPAAPPWSFAARAPTTSAMLDAVLETVADAQAGYVGLFDAIADALDGNPGREVTFVDARRSLEFVTAIYASSRDHKAVNLPLDKAHPLYTSWLP